MRLWLLRSPKGDQYYKEKQTLGLHAKCFIIDDIYYYIGYQNLFVCNLAKWGVVIANTVQSIKSQY